MVTSGAAPLIVYAFRRVRRGTSTETFQTGDAGRARVQLPSEAGTPDMTSGHADADQAGAHPYQHRCAGTRSRDATHVPPQARTHPYLRRTTEQLGSIIFPVAY